LRARRFVQLKAPRPSDPGGETLPQATSVDIAYSTEADLDTQ
jgi:hypothetical protein